MEHRQIGEIAADVVLAIAVIVIVARLLGPLFKRVRQPAVIAEIFAGIALGPSLLGLFPGQLDEELFPLDIRAYLTVIATLGLIIFMFIVGLDLNVDLVKGQSRVAITVSTFSVVLPFALGGVLALWLHASHDATSTATPGGDSSPIRLLPFVLFIGAAMSVTAFPVLARILTDRSMHRTPTGVLALACAAVDDILAWIMLAVVVAVAKSYPDPNPNPGEAAGGGVGDLLLTSAGSVLFVVLMFKIVRPMLRTLVGRHQRAGRLTPDLFAVVLVGVLLSSYVTEMIGIHFIFGAFLFGAIMPRKGAEVMSNEILERIEQITVLLLLPVFFITTGLKVDVEGIGSHGMLELGAVLLVACVGKFIGAVVGARVSGIPPRRATAIGILMNTRGLTELVILNVGLEIGVLDTELFTIMVLMAILTTVMTEPLLRWVYPSRLVDREIAQADRAALGLTADFRAVVAVGDRGAEPTVDLATLIGTGSSSEIVLSRLTPSFSRVEVGSGLGADLAAIAASFETTQTLASRAEASGARVVVRSQFSEDPTSDLRGLVDAVSADVLVVGTPDGVAPAILHADVDCPVAWLPFTESHTALAPTAILVSPGSDSHSSASVEQAVRAALTTGLLLTFVGTDRKSERRAVALHKQLAAAGIDSTVITANDSPHARDTLRFVEWNNTTELAEAVEATVVVRGAPGDHGEGLARLLATHISVPRDLA